MCMTRSCVCFCIFLGKNLVCRHVLDVELLQGRLKTRLSFECTVWHRWGTAHLIKNILDMYTRSLPMLRAMYASAGLVLQIDVPVLSVVMTIVFEIPGNPL